MTIAPVADPLLRITPKPGGLFTAPPATRHVLRADAAADMLSPWPRLCGFAGGTRTGAHVLVFTAGAGEVDDHGLEELDKIGAFDEAERRARSGKINVVPVSSFAGTADYARIWGLDFARNRDLDTARPLFLADQTPVYSLGMLTEAGRALLGPAEPAHGHFRVKPGAFTYCAQAKLEVPRGLRTCLVWAGIAIGIPPEAERLDQPCLMMESTGTIGAGRSVPRSASEPAHDQRLHHLALSVLNIARRRQDSYAAILAGVTEVAVPTDRSGGAWFAAQYLTLPEAAVPGGRPGLLAQTDLTGWTAAALP